MSTYSVTMKTHSQENLTENYPNLNRCILHGVKPTIMKTVAGKRKEIFYSALCICEGKYNNDCAKITTENPDVVVGYWNKWNPNND